MMSMSAAGASTLTMALLLLSKPATSFTNVTPFFSRVSRGVIERRNVLRVFAHDSASSITPRDRAFEVVSKLASRTTRTWKRLGPVVELALFSSPPTAKSAIDVGTDHGLVAISLAASGKFERVTGTDISPNALANAQTLRTEFEAYLRANEGEVHFPIELCCGPGLAHISPGSADVVCIAGMGVNTMQDIFANDQLEKIRCQQLILQPTNSRPRNLVSLYDGLHESGWTLDEEHMIELRGNWYLTCSFRNNRGENARAESDMPGSRLIELDDKSEMKQIFDNWAQHHCNWIRSGYIRDTERRWLNWSEKPTLQ